MAHTTKRKLYTSLYKSLQLIPKGKVTTYKELAIKHNIHPRYVGRILHQNDEPIEFPCYKVVRSDGKIASGYAGGGPKKQIKMLKADGVPFKENKVDLAKALCILRTL